MTKDGSNKFDTKDNRQKKADRIAYVQEIALIDKLIDWSIGELVNRSK